MKKIIHISDIHFGTVEEIICRGLLTKMNSENPDVVVISGDLTQRGRKKQYIQAREFIEEISFPKIIVPGNHDIPLFDIIRRFFSPLTRYKKYITPEMTPVYQDDEIIIMGINTARSFTWKNGRISIEQITEMERILCPVPNEKFKIVVTHHPFIPPPGDNGIALVGRSVRALKIIDKCYVDLLLAGHLHKGYSGDVRKYYPDRNRSVISVQAGTATSRRIRTQPNSFNIITVEFNSIDIEISSWDGEKFLTEKSRTFTRKDNSWEYLV